jgi:hypothetical protein
MILIREKPSASASLSVNLSSNCPTWIGLGFNPGLRGERPVTHHLTNGMAQSFS